jgi:thiosulfate/3-mercaptopyruvate sulfurtransferase
MEPDETALPPELPNRRNLEPQILYNSFSRRPIDQQRRSLFSMQNLRQCLGLTGVLFALLDSFVMADHYPNAKLLMEPADLAKSLDDFVVLDAREAPNYAELHIEGAHWVDHALWSKEFGDGDNSAAWSKRIGELGIDRETTVVVYDDNLHKNAARIWWTLRYWGVKDVRLLNEGWDGWFRQHLSFASGTPAPPEPKDFSAEPIAERLATKERLLRSLNNRDLQIVDSRSFAEHCGQDLGKNKRGGAIPGAKHLEWTDLIDKESGRFKSKDQLKALFEEAEISLDQPTATHCQSGGRSSVMVFAM